MGFNSRAFMQAKFVPRTVRIEVPALAAWFEEDEQPGWILRGLTGNELARVNDAERRNRREGALMEAINDGSRSEMVKEMQAALGRNKDTQPDIARRLELLVLGSVDPECSEELAVKLAKQFPVQFFELTNAVLQLTGRGSDAEKKPEPSGETAKSAQG